MSSQEFTSIKNFNYSLNFDEVFPYLLKFIGAKNQKDFAKIMGFTQGNVTNYKKKNKIPSDWLLKLAVEKNFSVDELVKKIYPDHASSIFRESTVLYNYDANKKETFTYSLPMIKNDDKNYVSLPLWNKSNFRIKDTQFMKIFALKSWLEPQLKAAPEEAFITIMEGDSMSPTINSGDFLICDGVRGPIENVQIEDFLYLIQFEGSGPIVRRIQRLPGKIFRIIADNPRYETFQIKNDHKCDVIGRVIWIIKKA